VKGIYNKPTANIILNGKKIKLSKIWNKTKMPTFATFIQLSAGGSSKSNRAKEGNEELKIGNYPRRQIIIVCR
jgi:hypothetical protein